MATTSRRCSTTEPELGPRARAGLSVILFIPELMVFGGIFTALLGWRPGAFLAVGGASLTFAWHLGLGVFSYRRTMRRPWPNVQPIEDDDDDW